MKYSIRPLDFAGFALTAAAALYQGWSLQEFCWSIWPASVIRSPASSPLRFRSC
jgi:hypothetical protein